MFTISVAGKTKSLSDTAQEMRSLFLHLTKISSAKCRGEHSSWGNCLRLLCEVFAAPFPGAGIVLFFLGWLIWGEEGAFALLSIWVPDNDGVMLFIPLAVMELIRGLKPNACS